MHGKTISFQKIRNKSRRFLALTLTGAAMLSLLAGCGKEGSAGGFLQKHTEPPTTVQTEPPATVPADGNPDDVTCKGSYTAEGLSASSVVAVSKDQKLTNGELNVLYRLAVNAWEDQENGPDFSEPLDTQICSLSQEGITWQQYFLQQALDSWSVLQALQQKSLEFVERQEDYFAPNPEKHEEYMTGMPILPILYDEDASFELNEKEQAFLDEIPEFLKQAAMDQGYETAEAMADAEFGVSQSDLQEMTHLINYAYFYFISHTYDLKFTPEEIDRAMGHVDGSSDPLVSLRYILVLPENSTVDAEGKVQASQEDWDKAETAAKEILRKFMNPSRQRNHKGDEAEFAQIAHDISQDPGSAINGGLFEGLRSGQITEPVNTWAFDPARQPEDTEVIKSDYGFHVVFYKGRETERDVQARNFLLKEHLQQLVEEAKLSYPVQFHYSEIQLAPVQEQGKVTMTRDLLYQDIGYERFTEVPVYLQQDYMDAPYAGSYKVGTHGCGISAFAMLSTYMTDTRMTPATCAQQFSRFGSKTGTDGRIFALAPSGIGFFLEKRTGFWNEVEEALRNGQKVVSVQWHGYFTRGGHYLVLSDMTEDDLVVIRDSNIYNYKRLKEHKEDKFKPARVMDACQGFWNFDKKIITLPTCVRCGDPETVPGIVKDHICPKCRAAQERRADFMELCGIQ